MNLALIARTVGAGLVIPLCAAPAAAEPAQTPASIGAPSERDAAAQAPAAQHVAVMALEARTAKPNDPQARNSTQSSQTRTAMPDAKPFFAPSPKP